MARFIPILGSLRGSIAGNTWSRNKGGDYIRRRSTPTNPQTLRQMATREILTEFATGWFRDLDNPQRSAWNAYAATHPILNSQGQSILITGLAWYVKVNSRLRDAAGTPILLPPIGTGPLGLDSVAVEFTDPDTVTVTYTPTPLLAGCRLQTWCSLPTTDGAEPNLAQCRLAGYSAAAQVSPATVNLPHTFQIGQKGTFYIAVLDDEGLLSGYLQTTAKRTV